MNDKRDVWFSPDEGLYYLISEERTKEEAWKDINTYLKNHKYKIPYVRIWEENKMQWYDIGSHSEFFVWARREDIPTQIISGDSI